MPMPSVFDHPDPATAMRMAFEQPPPPPPDGVQAYASLRTVSGIGAPAVPRDGTGSFRPPTDPRLAQPAQPAATALDAGIAASDIQNAMLDDAGRGRQASTGLATPVPLPPLQADDGRDVGTPNDMTWAEMTTIEKVAPRELGTIAGKDVQTLVTDESRSFFDGTEMVRKGCREGGGVTYMPAMDILRLSAVPLSSAKKEAQPAALVAAGTCTFHDIVMAKTAPNQKDPIAWLPLTAAAHLPGGIKASPVYRILARNPTIRNRLADVGQAVDAADTALLTTFNDNQHNGGTLAQTVGGAATAAQMPESERRTEIDSHTTADGSERHQMRQETHTTDEQGRETRVQQAHTTVTLSPEATAALAEQMFDKMQETLLDKVAAELAEVRPDVITEMRSAVQAEVRAEVGASIDNLRLRINEVRAAADRAGKAVSQYEGRQKTAGAAAQGAHAKAADALKVANRAHIMADTFKDFIQSSGLEIKQLQTQLQTAEEQLQTTDEQHRKNREETASAFFQAGEQVQLMVQQSSKEATERLEAAQKEFAEKEAGLRAGQQEIVDAGVDLRAEVEKMQGKIEQNIPLMQQIGATNGEVKTCLASMTAVFQHLVPRVMALEQQGQQAQQAQQAAAGMPPPPPPPAPPAPAPQNALPPPTAATEIEEVCRHVFYDRAVGAQDRGYTIWLEDIVHGGHGDAVIDTHRFRLSSLTPDGDIREDVAASCLVAAVNRKAPAGHRKRKSIGALDEYLFHEDVGVYHKRVRGVRGFRLGAP